MLIQKFILRAKIEKQRFESLRRWKEGQSFFTFLRYLIYRIRFPLLSRLVFKLIVIFEMAIIYFLFRSNFFSLVAIIIFLSFCLKGLLKGGMQFFRIKLVEFQKKFNQEKCNDYYYLAINFSIVLGLINSLGIIALAIFLEMDRSSLLIAFTTLIILPLESLSLALWAISYTQRRLKKEFLISTFYRIIPIILMLSCYRFMGEYSYILGYLIGNLLYINYHIKIALDSLRFNFYTYRKPIQLRYLLTGLLRSRVFRQIYSLPVAYYLYLLCLGCFLYLHSNYYWRQYIFLYFSISFLSGFAIQVSRSLAMDIHLALKEGHLEQAYQYAKRTIVYTLIFLGLTLSILTLLYVKFPYWVGYSSSVLLNYFVLVLIAIVAKTFFETSYKIIEVTKTEIQFQRFMLVYFLLFTIPLQYYLIYIANSNIQGIILLDSVIIIGASLIVLLRIDFSRSLLLNIYRQQVSQRTKSLSLKAWLAATRASLASNQPLEFAIIFLDKSYTKSYYSNYIGRSIQRISDSLTWQTEIFPGVLLITFPANSDLGIANLQFQLSGLIRFVMKIDFQKDLQVDLLKVKGQFRLIGADKKSIRLMESIFLMLHEERCYQELKHAKLHKLSIEELVNLIKIKTETKFKQQTDFIYLDKKGNLATIGKLKLSKARDVYQKLIDTRRNTLFVPNNSRFVVFSRMGDIIIVAHLKRMNARQLSFLYSLAFAIEYWTVEAYFQCPNKLLNVSFTDYQLISKRLLQFQQNPNAIYESKKLALNSSELFRCEVPRFRRYIGLKQG